MDLQGPLWITRARSQLLAILAPCVGGAVGVREKNTETRTWLGTLHSHHSEMFEGDGDGGSWVAFFSARFLKSDMELACVLVE